jgi:hypothetical protein
MAQHDYVIDNQASASARADLNSLFQAIASQNSGATAPTTTYANMIWYDTANDLLKMRNEANSGWITVGTLDQALNTFTAPSVNGKTVGTLTAAGGIAYATSSTALAAIGAGAAGQVLFSGGAGAPAWGSLTLGGVTTLGTISTTSGATATLSGLNLTSYKFVVASFDGVSCSSNFSLRLGTSAGVQLTATMTNVSQGINGIAYFDISLGKYFSDTVLSSSGAADTYAGSQSTITTASTSISFAFQSGNFDAGQIRLYGVA